MAGLLYCGKGKNDLRRAFSFIENADLGSFWGFLPLKILKKGAAWVLFY